MYVFVFCCRSYPVLNKSGETVLVSGGGRSPPPKYMCYCYCVTLTVTLLLTYQTYHINLSPLGGFYYIYMHTHAARGLRRPAMRA